MAGVGADDIDVAEIYDCFTFTVLCQLEVLGFCKKGEGGAVRAGRPHRAGRRAAGQHPWRAAVPGAMSRAQPRHRADAPAARRGGKAQVKDAEIGLVTGYGDMGDGSLAILRRAA